MSSIEEQEFALLQQRIVRLEEDMDLLFQHLGLTRGQADNATEDPQLIKALKANRMIEAIKIYREKTGVGLAEAKSAVEALRLRLGM